MKVFIAILALFFSGALYADSISVTVKTFAALARPFVSDAPAEIVALNLPQISAEINARVIKLNVLEGDRVQAGDVLVELDCQKAGLVHEISAAAVKRSKAQLDFAGSQLKRARDLKKNKSISEELLDQRSTELQVAKAELATQNATLKQAAIDKEHCLVRSPFSAVVTDRLVSEGDYVNAGVPVMALMQLENTEIQALLHQQQLDSIKQADKIWLVVNDRQYPLQLRAIQPVYLQSAETAQVSLTLLQPQEDIWPGSRSRIYWSTKQKQLSSEYFSLRNQQLGVFVVKNDRAGFYPVASAIEGRPAIVDLADDTPVIVEGRQRLQDGDAISVVETN